MFLALFQRKCGFDREKAVLGSDLLLLLKAKYDTCTIQCHFASLVRFVKIFHTLNNFWLGAWFAVLKQTIWFPFYELRKCKNKWRSSSTCENIEISASAQIFE